MSSSVKILSCRVCFGDFDQKLNKPMILQPCGHSFCEQCVHIVRAGSSKICPTCRLPIKNATYNQEFTEVLNKLSTQGAALAKAKIEEESLKNQMKQIQQLTASPMEQALVSGFNELEQGRYDSAIFFCNQVINDPTASPVQKNEARLMLLKIENTTTSGETAALSIFNQIMDDPSVELNTKFSAMNTMGFVYLNNGKNDKAADLFNEVLNSPDAPVGCKIDARLHLITCETFEKAKHFFDGLIADLNISNRVKAKAHLEMGKRYEIEDYEQAMPLFRRALSNPEAEDIWKVDARLCLGILLRNKESEEAIPLLNEVISDQAAPDPCKIIARLTLGEIYVETQNDKLAAQVLREVINDPEASSDQRKSAEEILSSNRCVIL